MTRADPPIGQGQSRDTGFITAGERALIASLVERHCLGDARVIEGGAFIGAATRAILDGMRGRAFAHSRPLISIDRFVADDDYIVEALLLNGHDIRPGESFLTAFLVSIGPDVERVEVRAGDLMRVGRLADPVDFIMVDVAKTPALYMYILRDWFTKAVPGRTIVFHQDWWSPMLPWVMSMTAPLLEHFELIVPQEGESAVFRLLTPLSPQDVSLATPPRSVDEIQLRYAALRSAFPKRTHPLLLLNEASSALGLGLVRYAAERLHEAEAQPGRHEKFETWTQSLRQMISRRLQASVVAR